MFRWREWGSKIRMAVEYTRQLIYLVMLGVKTNISFENIFFSSDSVAIASRGRTFVGENSSFVEIDKSTQAGSS